VANDVGTTEDFRQMFLEDRKCRLPDESDNLFMFKSYSKSACKFECASNTAVDTCLCKPWSVPRFPGENTPYCDMIGNACFYGILVDTHTYDNCECDDDCQFTTFNVFQSSSPLKQSAMWGKYLIL